VKKKVVDILSKKHLRIELYISFYNEYFIGGGRGSGIIDSFVIKDSENKPYIPASTIKGRIKYNFALLLNTFKNQLFCGFDNMDRGTKNKNCQCIICKWFGREGNKPGILYFNDLKLNDKSQSFQNDYSIRSGILIDRYTKNAMDKALFTIETSGMGGAHKFAGEIEGYVDSEDFKNYIPILYTAIAMIETLGGSQSRGLGWLSHECSIKVFENNNEIDAETIRNWGELLEV